MALVVGREAEPVERAARRGPAERLRDRLVVAGSPVDLAIVRIVFFAVAYQVSITSLPARMADLPAELRTVPTGAGWLYDLVPPDGSLARAGAVVMAVSALAALVGWHARLAAGVWAGAALWTVGITDLYGKVDHNHHLLWFAVLLAASPCADVLSVDALRRRGAAPPPAPHPRYGLPIRIWWLLIGLVYLFAGAWKVAELGLGWASPANLRPLLHSQWAAAADGFEPVLRIDQVPVLLVLMGVGTLLFELGFVALVLTRARPFAVGAGLAFHLGTYLVLDIAFTTLVLCYVAFVPWAAALPGAPDRAADRAEPRGRRRPDRLTVAVATVLVGGVVLAGAGRVVDGWPFAAYPTFAGRTGDARVEVELELALADGTVRTASLDEVFAWVPPSKRGRVAGQLLALPAAEQAGLLREMDLDAVAGQPVRSVVTHRAVYSTDPDDPRLLERERLAEVTLGP